MVKLKRKIFRPKQHIDIVKKSHRPFNASNTDYAVPVPAANAVKIVNAR